MLFARRQKPDLGERIRVALLPRRNYMRSTRYIGYRIVRLGGNPHGLALGLAIGIFVATLPIIGLQILAAVTLAWLLRANIAAALLGTFWANPITSPFIWLASYGLGSLVLPASKTLTTAELGERLWQVRRALFAPGSETLSASYSLLWPILKPTLLGAVPVGMVTSIAFYYGCLHLIGAYRSTRADITEWDTEGIIDTGVIRIGGISGKLS
jgi:uncharacterized protein (DUF2062 family)